MTTETIQTLPCRCGRLVRVGPDATAVTCDLCTQHGATLTPACQGRTCPDCGADLTHRRRYCPTCARERRRLAARVCRAGRHRIDPAQEAPATPFPADLANRQGDCLAD